MMSNDILTQRQRWFRFFPEGSIEFLVATRVLALILLLALLVVGKVELQLLATVVALTGVLWLDYVLMVWWAVQIVLDLEDLPLRQTTSAQVLQRRRVHVGILVCLPSVIAGVLLAPWPALLRIYQPGLLPGEAIITAGCGILVVLFIVLVVLAQRAMQRIRLGPPLWTLLLMIPVAHWFAMHRLIVRLEGRLREYERTNLPVAGERAADSPAWAITIADATWVLAILPWALVVILTLTRGNWPTEFPQAAVPFCGVPLAAVFAVADLAAMERIQRQFIATLRRL